MFVLLRKHSFVADISVCYCRVAIKRHVKRYGNVNVRWTSADIINTEVSLGKINCKKTKTSTLQILAYIKPKIGIFGCKILVLFSRAKMGLETMYNFASPYIIKTSWPIKLAISYVNPDEIKFYVALTF